MKPISKVWIGYGTFSCFRAVHSYGRLWSGDEPSQIHLQPPSRALNVVFWPFWGVFQNLCGNLEVTGSCDRMCSNRTTGIKLKVPGDLGNVLKHLTFLSDHCTYVLQSICTVSGKPTMWKKYVRGIHVSIVNFGLQSTLDMISGEQGIVCTYMCVISSLIGTFCHFLKCTVAVRPTPIEYMVSGVYSESGARLVTSRRSTLLYKLGTSEIYSVQEVSVKF